jgi:ubiquinone/menaquinone biosynthesis C-methylase UbiE
MNSPESSSQFNALAAHYDELMQVVPYDLWADYVMTLFALVGHHPRRVLDCACGTGNVTFELTRHGLNMTGVDLSAHMIGVARAKLDNVRADDSPAPIRFFQADLTNFDLGETFDAATCLYDSLNYILNPVKLQASFGRIAAHVEPGGVFVFDMNSEYALMTDLFTQRENKPTRNLHYDWRAQFDRDSKICTVTMHFERKTAGGAVEEFNETHRERAYSRREIETMLAATGWDLLHTFDAYTLNRPHDRSERWYFVARREE